MADLTLQDLTATRPLAEYHEKMGPVLWWSFPVREAPYVGSPSDLGHVVEMHTDSGADQRSGNTMVARANVGGWPGYHTHFTPIPVPATPLRPVRKGYTLPENDGHRHDFDDKGFCRLCGDSDIPF